MRREQPLHRVTIGRTREVRGPDSLERGVVGMVIAVVMMLAVGFGVRQMRMCEVIEAATLASSAQYEEIVYRAVHGTWPSPDNAALVTDGIEGTYVRQTRLGKNGGITMQLALGRPGSNTRATHVDTPATATARLSFRPQLLGVPGYQAVTLLCGYAKPVGPTNMPLATNETTLDKRDLPPSCR